MSVKDWIFRRAGVRASARPVLVTRMGRRDLPAMTKALGMTRGAEIGVWRGAFSASLCQGNSDLHMLCVDPWRQYPGWMDNKAVDADWIEGAYRDACHLLQPFKTTIVRKHSVEAAADVPDRSLDFVYIDGNHVFDAVTDDLTAWTPKVKAGGFIAGHDYRVFPNKPAIHVVAAVQAFTKSRDIDPWFVLSAERTPSFLWEAA